VDLPGSGNGPSVKFFRPDMLRDLDYSSPARRSFVRPRPSPAGRVMPTRADIEAATPSASQKCQKQAWENVPVPCPRCGHGKWRKAKHCQKCEDEMRTAARNARDDDIVLMWNEGMSQREIAVTLGYSPNSHPPELSRLMSEGRIKARREGYRRKHREQRAP
jgi:hypothetical protein